MRNSDGSWSLRNIYYDDEEEALREAPPDYSMPPISELRCKAAIYSGRAERAGEPPAHLNAGDWIARNSEMRRRRPPAPDAPPPPVRFMGGTRRHVNGRWHPRNFYPEPDVRQAKKPRLYLR